MFLGYVFIALCESVLDEKEYSLGELSGANAKRAMLVLLIMTMHSFAEGLGVGVSWAGSKGSVQGKFVTTAIGVHNIPEGMTVALLMVPVTKSGARAPHQPAPSTRTAHSAGSVPWAKPTRARFAFPEDVCGASDTLECRAPQLGGVCSGRSSRTYPSRSSPCRPTSSSKPSGTSCHSAPAPRPVP